MARPGEPGEGTGIAPAAPTRTAIEDELENALVLLEDAEQQAERHAADAERLDRTCRDLTAHARVLQQRIDALTTRLDREQAVRGRLADRQALARRRFAEESEVYRQELAQQRAEYLDRHQHLQTILSHAPGAILTIDAALLVRSANRAAESIFGRPAEGLVGTRLQALIDPPSWRRLTAHMSQQRALEEGTRGFLGEIEGLMPDRTPIPLEASLSPVGGSSGLGWIAILRDLRDRKAAERQLLQASKLATLGEMSAGLAHEIRQPLHIIRMVAEILLRRSADGTIEPGRLQEKLATIVAQSGRMDDIINHMQAFSRPEAGTARLFDPAGPIRVALELFAAQDASRDIRLVTAVPDRCRPVRGHPIRLEQVIVNLLNNARDAIIAGRRTRTRGEGRDRIDLVVDDDPSSPSLFVRVSDTGGGVPAQFRDQIFEPFFTTKEAGQGTGLGLSISTSIIGEMGGTIRLRDGDADGGATFDIRLPVHPGAEAGALPAPPTSREGNGAVPGRRILLVEDDMIAARGMRAFLEDEGYSVIAAPDGENALIAMATGPADLVITDLKLPGMTGEDLTARLLARRPDLPVLVLTGRCTPETEAALKRGGVRAVCRKPFQIQVLADVIRRLLAPAQDG